MERVQVSSSNLFAVGYDLESQTLEIEFNDGSIYQYYDVPESTYQELMEASSLGSFLHYNIKGVYGFSKV